MSIAPAAARPMTAEEFLALPDDGVERWLIDGVLHENPESEIGCRNRHHSTALGNITGLLGTWVSNQSEPHGEIACGDVGVIFNRQPDTMLGIDLIYVDAETADRETRSDYFETPPILAVEVLSPQDTQREITARILTYLRFGVRVVWIIDTDLQTVTVYRPGNSVISYSNTQMLAGDPELPGFSCAVADIFE